MRDDSAAVIELGPELIELGEVAGLLRPKQGPGDGGTVVGRRGDETEVVLDPDWFEDPLGQDGLGGVPGRIETLLGLLQTAGLLGAAEEEADAGGATLWHPILAPPTAGAEPAPTGLYLLYRPVPDSPGEGALGIAFRGSLASGGVSLQGRAVVPVLELAGGGARLVAGSEGHPIRLGLSIGAAGGPLASHGFGFGSFELEAELSASPGIRFAFTGIELPELGRPEFPGSGTQGELDLEAIRSVGEHGEAWLRLLLDLLVAQLGERAVASLADVEYLLGLAEDSVPAPDWQRLFEDPGAGLGDWFGTEIAGEPEVLRRWLHGWLCLFRGFHIDERRDRLEGDVAGAGTADDPFSIAVVDIPGIVRLSLNLGGTAEALTLGAGIASPAYGLTDGAALRLTAELALVSFRLPHGQSGLEAAAYLPRADVALALVPPSGGGDAPLFAYRDFEAPSRDLRLGSVELGLGITAGGIEPRLEAVGLGLGAAAPRDYPLEDLLAGRDGAGLVVRAVAEALKAAYSNTLPTPQTGAADLARRYETLRTCNRILRTVLDFTGLAVPEGDGPFASAVDDLAGALIGWAAGNDDLPGSALDWLVGRVGDPAMMSRTFGGILGGFNSDFTVDGSLIRFQATDSVSLGLGVKDGLFGVWIAPRLEVDWLSFGLEGGIGFQADLSAMSEPELSLGVRLSADAERLAVPGLGASPELVGELTGSGSFSLRVYPQGAAEGDGIELLPRPADGWLEQLATQLILPVASGVALGNDSVRAILATPFPGTDAGAGIDLGAILAGAGLLTSDDGELRLSSAGKLARIAPDDFLEAALAVLTSAERFTIAGGDDQGLWIVQDEGRYGLQVRLAGVGAGPKRKPGRPQIQLQVGQWLSGESDDDNWVRAAGGGDTGSPGGVRLFLLSSVGAFKPRIEMSSVGIDIAGAGGRPLFARKGYRVDAIESRLSFSWEEGSTPELAGGIKLRELGMPLGPGGGDQAGSTNPVAASLVSGDGAGDRAAAAAPTYSAVVAHAGRFHGEVLSDVPSADGKAWVPVRRSFGPLYCRQLGLGFETGDEPRLGIGYDGSVALGPLAIELDRLTVEIPLREPQELDRYELGLQGLDVSYKGGPVSISGGFLEAPGRHGPQTQYDGMALISAAGLAITAFGSYTTVAQEPSLFIFAVLHRDLGGPAFFRVNGLAAGFGYNRGLKLPPVEEVQDFPLVRYALDEDAFAGGGAEDSIVRAMHELREYIPASSGEYWFAAGVRFSSFEMIQSFAMLSVSFGREVQIALLGLSRMSVPTDAKPGQAIAYAELALRAVIKPEEGSIEVEARLTDESFILDKSCHLTGGFAFYTWLGGPHAGDFVVSLGGYHPEFSPPAHYPAVPRLGVDWRVSDELSLTAQMYFALTPSCVMAGGELSVVYDGGWVQAWFRARVDFLLSWKPFYYQIGIGIEIGFAADLGLFTVRLSLSVALELWGPEFAGQIDVDLSVVSFSVSFGEPKSAPEPLSAREFVESFLPSDPAGVISARIDRGLIRQETLRLGEREEELRVVNAHALSLTVQSIIPATRFGDLAPTGNGAGTAGPSFGIQPMGKTRLSSTLEISISGVEKSRDNLRVELVETGVPEALWGPSERDGAVPLPGKPKAETISAISGLRISFAPRAPEGALPAMEIEKFEFETFRKPIPWDETVGPASAIPALQLRELLERSGVIAPDGGVPPQAHLAVVEREPVTTARDAVLEVLARDSPFELNRVDLSRLAETRTTYFQAPPEIKRTGEVFS